MFSSKLINYLKIMINQVAVIVHNANEQDYVEL